MRSLQSLSLPSFNIQARDMGPYQELRGWIAEGNITKRVSSVTETMVCWLVNGGGGLSTCFPTDFLGFSHYSQ